MVERRLGVIWAAFAAAVLGVLIAALTGGSTPSVILLAALVAVPAAITFFVRMRPRASHGGRRVSAPPTGARVGPDQQVGEADWEAVSVVCSALDGRQLDWLSSSDFVTPWLDGRARPVIELAPFVAELVDVPFDRDIQGALLGLADAIEQFVAFYRGNTSADPLLLGDEWRFFEWDDPRPGEERAPDEELWGGRAAELHELAARVADSYEAFTIVASRDPRSQSRTRVLVRR